MKITFFDAILFILAERFFFNRAGWCSHPGCRMIRNFGHHNYFCFKFCESEIEVTKTWYIWQIFILSLTTLTKIWKQTQRINWLEESKRQRAQINIRRRFSRYPGIAKRGTLDGGNCWAWRWIMALDTLPNTNFWIFNTISNKNWAKIKNFDAKFFYQLTVSWAARGGTNYPSADSTSSTPQNSHLLWTNFEINYEDQNEQNLTKENKKALPKTNFVNSIDVKTKK